MNGVSRTRGPLLLLAFLLQQRSGLLVNSLSRTRSRSQLVACPGQRRRKRQRKLARERRQVDAHQTVYVHEQPALARPRRPHLRRQ